MQDVEIIEFLSTDDEGQSQESEEDQAEARWMILRCFKNWHISEKLVSISIFMLTVADIGFKWKTIEFVSFTQDIHHPPMDQQVPSPIPHHDSDEADMQDTDVMDISLTDEEAQPQESEGINQRLLVDHVCPPWWIWEVSLAQRSRTRTAAQGCFYSLDLIMSFCSTNRPFRQTTDQYFF